MPIRSIESSGYLSKRFFLRFRFEQVAAREDTSDQNGYNDHAVHGRHFGLVPADRENMSYGRILRVWRDVAKSHGYFRTATLGMCPASPLPAARLSSPAISSHIAQRPVESSPESRCFLKFSIPFKLPFIQDRLDPGVCLLSQLLHFRTHCQRSARPAAELLEEFRLPRHMFFHDGFDLALLIRREVEFICQIRYCPSRTLSAHGPI